MRHGKTLGLVLLGLVTIAVLGTALSSGMTGGSGPGGTMVPGMMWGSGYGASVAPWGANGWPWGLAMGLGMLVMLAFWGALALGIVLLARWVIGRPAPTVPMALADDPAVILRRRYASGEIDQPTYERMKRELGA